MGWGRGHPFPNLAARNLERFGEYERKLREEYMNAEKNKEKDSTIAKQNNDIHNLTAAGNELAMAAILVCVEGKDPNILYQVLSGWYEQLATAARRSDE